MIAEHGTCADIDDDKEPCPLDLELMLETKRIPCDHLESDVKPLAIEFDHLIRAACCWDARIVRAWQALSDVSVSTKLDGPMSVENEERSAKQVQLTAITDSASGTGQRDCRRHWRLNSAWRCLNGATFNGQFEALARDSGIPPAVE